MPAALIDGKAIAQELHLSVNTVRNYVQAILTKLGAHSKLEAVSIAVREGKLDLGTRDELGYVLTDIGTEYPGDMLARLRELDLTIRLRTTRPS